MEYQERRSGKDRRKTNRRISKESYSFLVYEIESKNKQILKLSEEIRNLNEQIMSLHNRKFY